MKINDTMHGFRVLRVKALDELKAVLYHMEHMKTGLELVWLSRQEDNKTFGIAFETLPWDDTGVFHILEHSVLGGSQRYPVKEPFVELLKNSMNTFLNAMTFPDKTFYPVSSRNNKDFLNLMRVYLDAVFNPSIYHKPEIFHQEGWHYELDDEGKAIYKGVVFNEMKGAYADADTLVERAVTGALFPDNCYRYDAGGDPAAIPDLTYEDFIDSHRRFYAPSNAYVYLDGDLDIDTVLKIMEEEYLCGYEKTQRMAPPAFQSPVKTEEQRVLYEVGPDEELDGKNRMVWASVIGRYDSQEEVAAVQILSEVLCGNNKSPLSKAVLSQGLAEQVSLRVEDGVLQPFVTLTARNVKADQEKKTEQVIFDELRRLTEEGLDHHQIETTMANLEFRLRERDYGAYPQGLIFGFQVLESWLYGGLPEENLEIGNLFVSLREKLEQGWFEEQIKKLLLENPHSCKVVLEPSRTAGEERRKKEQQRLEQESSAWTQETRDLLLSQQETLTQWQNSVDTPEQLATLPHLELEDVSDPPEYLPLAEKQYAGLTVLEHEIPTNGILYANLYFDVPVTSPQQLCQLSLLTDLLGKVNTTHSTVEELTNRSRLYCGRMSFYMNSFAEPNQTDNCSTKLVASFSALESNWKQALDLVLEILTETRLSDETAVLEILRQTKQYFYERTINSGSTVARGRLEAMYSVSGMTGEYTGGMEYYYWMKRQEKEWNWEALCQGVTNAAKQVIGKDRLTFSITGSCGSFAVGLAETMAEKLPVSEKVEETICIQPMKPRREGILIPADIGFAARGGDLNLVGSQYRASYKLAARVIHLAYLWNVIRVQGGAYGTGLSVNHTGVAVCHSYRDPSTGASLEHYLQCGEFLRRFCKEGGELVGYLIGAVSDESPLMTPRLKGSAADSLYWRKISYEMRCRSRKELLSTTDQELTELSKYLEAAIASGAVCVVGGQNQLDSCQLDEILNL